MSLEVKICGVCRPADAAVVAAAGADWLGVILSAAGPRHRSDEEAEAIYAAARGVRRAGVFVDEAAERVAERARRLRLEAVQLHGDEDDRVVAALVEAGPWQVWKAIRVRTPGDALAGIARYGDRAHALVLDGWVEGRAGGTGTGFDWSAVAGALGTLRRRPRLFAAGGLDVRSVAAAIRALAPAGVDVSSGVEAAIGRKSATAVRAFVAAARAASERTPARAGEETLPSPEHGR